MTKPIEFKTKPIKFNLIIDGKPIRDIDGLKDNFNIDDVLAHYKSGLLQRWLKVRKEGDNLLKSVDDIKAKDDLEIAKSLISIFQQSYNEQEMKEAVYPIVFRREEEERLKRFRADQFKKKGIINEYHKTYNDLCKQLKEKKGDYAFIKNACQKIHSDFFELFKLNYDSIFFDFIESAPLCVLGILANEELRNYFIRYHEGIKGKLREFIKHGFHNIGLMDIENKIEATIKKCIDEFEKTNTVKDIELYYFASTIKKDARKIDFKGEDEIVIISSSPNAHVEAISLRGKRLRRLRDDYVLKRIENDAAQRYKITYTTISNINNKLKMLNYSFTLPELRKYILTFAGETEKYWKDIEPSGSKFMIIYMEEGNFVRNAAKHGEEKSAIDVNGNFPILDGIDYKSNNPNHTLFYMKV